MGIMLMVGLVFFQVVPSIAQVSDGAKSKAPLSSSRLLNDQDEAKTGLGDVSTPSEFDDVSTHSEMVDSVSSMNRVLSGQPEPSEVLRRRLIAVGFGVGLVLALLGTLFGYLRMDHATRGFHSGRLQMAALGVATLILAAGYFLWTQLLFK